jgi:hypothetical protein
LYLECMLYLPMMIDLGTNWLSDFEISVKTANQGCSYLRREKAESCNDHLA